MVVGRGHRHDLLGADHAAPTLPRPGGVGDRAGGDDRALAGHQARHGGDRAEPARVGERHVGALRSSAVSVFVARLVDQAVEGRQELGERQAPGVADDRHHQRARAVLLLHVDGEAEVHAAVVDAVRLAVALLEVVRHHRHRLGPRARDRVGDQVREGDLLAGLLELLAARVHRRDGDRAEGGRGRDRRGSRPCTWRASPRRRGSAAPRRPRRRAARRRRRPWPPARRPSSRARRGPLPLTAARSTPSAAAMRAATGEALTPSGGRARRRRPRPAAAESCAGGGAARRRGRAPAPSPACAR